MTKTRSAKRALLTSGLVLIMCITMLIGTTFAWFTDSVTSGRNQIVAGNLDVELEYWNGTAYAPVTSATKLFNDNALWEPGYTEVAYLKVSNLGSLALKYQLNVNVFGETLGKTKGGADIKLSDYLVFKTVESDTDLAGAYATREAAVAAAGTEKGLKAYNGATKPLDPKGGANADDYVALIIYMPTTVGNEANHNGTNVPSIEMGVNLLATQLTAEEDSFDNTYDENAWHPDFLVTNSDELKVALTNGGNVKLANDVIISESLPVTKDTVLDLNGKNIGTSGSTTGSPLYLQGGKLTVKNGTLDLDGSHTNVNGTFSTGIGYDAQTELVVENVNFTGKTAINGTFATDGPLKVTVSDCTIDVTSVGIAVSANSTDAVATITNCNIDADEYAIFASQGSKITINGGTYKSAGKVITSMYDNTVVTINGGNFDGELWVTGGGSLVIYGGTFTADPSAYVANGYIATKNADGTYTVVKGATVASPAEFTKAIENGGNIVLTDNIELTSTLMAKKDAVIDLNGKSITAPSDSAMFQSLSGPKPSLTITSSKAGAVIDATNSTFNNGIVQSYGKTEIRNVTINAGNNAVLLGYGSTEISNVEINVGEIKSSSYTTFKVYGDLTLGEGTVVNVDYLGTSLISNNAKANIVIDGAKINVDKFRVSGGAMINLQSGTTLALKNTEVKVGLDTTYTSYFITRAENATIENCTFDIKNLDGTKAYDIEFKPDASVGDKYVWVQK